MLHIPTPRQPQHVEGDTDATAESAYESAHHSHSHETGVRENVSVNEEHSGVRHKHTRGRFIPKGFHREAFPDALRHARIARKWSNQAIRDVDLAIHKDRQRFLQTQHDDNLKSYTYRNRLFSTHMARVPTEHEYSPLRRDSSLSIENTLISIEEFDICYVLPSRKFMKNADAIIPSRRVAKILECVCRIAADDNTHTSFVLKDLLSRIDGMDLSRGDLQGVIYELFARCLIMIGCQVRAFRGINKSHIFLKARLSEEDAMMFAEHVEYPLQVESTNYPHAETWLKDSDFSLPVIPFQVGAESAVGGFRAFYDNGRVWTRYDRTSRPMKINYDPSDPELSIFRDIDRIRLLNRCLAQYFDIPYMIKNDFLLTTYCLHQPSRTELFEKRNLLSAYGARRTENTIVFLNELRSYYGEEVAFCFAFYGYYTRMVITPAILGVFAFVMQLWFGLRTYHITTIYMFAVAIWSVVFTRFWRRYEYRLRIRWSVSETKHIEMAREGATSTARFEDYRTGLEIRREHILNAAQLARNAADMAKARQNCVVMFQHFRRFWTNRLAFVVTLCTILFASASTYGVRYILLDQLAKREAPKLTRFHVEIIIAVASAIQIRLFNFVLPSLARWLTSMEEHDNFENSFKKSLIIKLFTFRFVNTFSPLLYTAFSRVLEKHANNAANLSVAKYVQIDLAVIFGSEMAWRIFRLVIPTFLIMAEQHSIIKHSPVPMSRTEQQYYKKPYGDLYVDDILNVCIHFCFVTLFSVALPIIPCISFLVTLLEVRLNRHRLSHTLRRPFPSASLGLGVWIQTITLASHFSLFVSCSLSIFTYGLVASDNVSTNLAVLAILEHSLLALSLFLNSVIPIKPYTCRIARMRQRLLRDYIIWGSQAQSNDRRSERREGVSIQKNLMDRRVMPFPRCLSLND